MKYARRYGGLEIERRENLTYGTSLVAILTVYKIYTSIYHIRN
jgi:hypothetical protein